MKPLRKSGFSVNSTNEEEEDGRSSSVSSSSSTEEIFVGKAKKGQISPIQELESPCTPMIIQKQIKYVENQTEHKEDPRVLALRQAELLAKKEIEEIVHELKIEKKFSQSTCATTLLSKKQY